MWARRSTSVLRQAENALGDDVLLDVRGTAADHDLAPAERHPLPASAVGHLAALRVEGRVDVRAEAAAELPVDAVAPVGDLEVRPELVGREVELRFDPRDEEARPRVFVEDRVFL